MIAAHWTVTQPSSDDDDGGSGLFVDEGGDPWLPGRASSRPVAVGVGTVVDRGVCVRLLKVSRRSLVGPGVKWVNQQPLNCELLQPYRSRTAGMKSPINRDPITS